MAPLTLVNAIFSYNGQCGFFWDADYYGFTAEVAECLAVGNADVGIYLFIGAGIFHVQNCTMVGNDIGFSYEWNFPKTSSATQTLALVDTSTVENCIMAFNERYGTSSSVWAGSVIVRCNDAFGNLVEDFHDIGFGPDDDYGNISADPLFCDRDNDNYYLRAVFPLCPEITMIAVF